MKQTGMVWSSKYRPVLAYIFCALIVAGLFTTRFARVIPSIGMIGLLLTALLAPDFKKEVRTFWTNKAFLAIAGIFVLHLVTIFYTNPDNYRLFQKELEIKLPLLALPMAFALLP
ncbi:MAG: hypothetical protein LPK19_14200, partial [Hymenobacteraceae bacterium]|nr:hypothetical protein [Hymenobacteraceae bacterium]MDX5397382.1 hypothetical protein [Hymenobacteraceae bacterium]MDX5513460.1 hypothetical protein [Hymenobacteraceae bacterium]